MYIFEEERGGELCGMCVRCVRDMVGDMGGVGWVFSEVQWGVDGGFGECWGVDNAVKTIVGASSHLF
jgi:hypothetical protein